MVLLNSYGNKSIPTHCWLRNYCYCLAGGQFVIGMNR